MTGNHFDELETTRAWKEDTLAKITVYSMQVGKSPYSNVSEPTFSVVKLDGRVLKQNGKWWESQYST